LDRFLMRVSLGYPDAQAERRLLAGDEPRELLTRLTAVVDAPALIAMQLEVRQVHRAPALLDYVQQLVAVTRTRTDLKLGLSPRAALGLTRAAQAHAYIEGRGAVLPEVVQAVLPAVVAHRLERRDVAGTPAPLAAELVRAVPVPV
ncbi:MAG TPA: MoxR family ATPase, partial [Steroidobacteraceae bacterium]|nr:MoxR family ATPase [Steroidobacteraceae bacterium]